MRRKFFIHTITVFVLILVSSGCAGIRPAGFPYATETIYESAYFPLIQMCQQENVVWDYDPLSEVVILKKNRTRVELLVGSDQAIVDSLPVRLKGPVVLRDSVVWAPVEVRTFLVPESPLKIEGENKAGFMRPVRVVVLDPGHGGKDPGAVGKSGLQEKDVVLDVARRVKKELEAAGLTVYLTRDEDRFIPLASRPKIASRKKADIFVSIHANANHSRWIEGFEVYYLSESVDDDARARESAENSPLELEDVDLLESFSLKTILWDMIYTENRKESIELARILGDIVSRQMDLKMLGVRGARFVVLKGSSVPSVLVEVGYLSNLSGEHKLYDSVYRQKLAESITAGILQFKQLAEKS